jgi:hypothetical protein
MRPSLRGRTAKAEPFPSVLRGAEAPLFHGGTWGCGTSKIKSKIKSKIESKIEIKGKIKIKGGRDRIKPLRLGVRGRNSQ